MVNSRCVVVAAAAAVVVVANVVIIFILRTDALYCKRLTVSVPSVEMSKCITLGGCVICYYVVV